MAGEGMYACVPRTCGVRKDTDCSVPLAFSLSAGFPLYRRYCYLSSSHQGTRVSLEGHGEDACTVCRRVSLAPRPAASPA